MNTQQQKKQDNTVTTVLLTILIAIVSILMVVASKPPDEVCIREVTTKYLGHNDINEFLANSGASEAIYRVEDHGFYKVVVNNITGREMATCVFWNVFPI